MKWQRGARRVLVIMAVLAVACLAGFALTLLPPLCGRVHEWPGDGHSISVCLDGPWANVWAVLVPFGIPIFAGGCWGIWWAIQGFEVVRAEGRR
jgi:hypothetical protein